MSALFEGYERQYCELSGNASRHVTSLPSLSGDSFHQSMAQLDAMFSEADSLIRLMDLEARSVPAGQKASLLAKLREYRADLQALKKSAAAAEAASAAPAGHEALSSSRAELLGETQAGEASIGQRAKLLGTTAALEESSSRLDASRRALLETEELGVGILEDLHQQRQTLLHARETLFGVDDSISRGRQILLSMARRMNRNKLIAVFIIILLVVAILLVVVLKLRAHK